jgi:energy-coupling factor transporter ATP-binding protein EcfA2
VPAAEVAAHHGVLLVERGEVRVEAVAGAVVALMRDGVERVTLRGDHNEGVALQAGDTLLLGGERGAQVMLVSVAVSARPLWQAHALPDEPRSLELALLEGALRRFGEPEALLQLATQAIHTRMEITPARLVLSLFTPEEEFLDDVHGYTPGVDGQRAVYAVCPDPLAVLGEAGMASLEVLADRGWFVSVELGERFGLLVGLARMGLPAGWLLVELEQAPDLSRDWGALLRELRPLAELMVHGRQDEQRARALAEENTYFRERERRHYLFKELICESESMRRVYEQLNTMVTGTEPVMILGEAGSGKELLARAIHHLGPGREGMFISLHCGRLGDEVLGIELFGCVASELAGALAPRKGVFELAGEGTIYLDEIDLLSPMMQGKLVRMIKEGEVRRVGDSVGRRVQARLVASTHRSPKELVQSGRLRQDLHMLLHDHTLEVPALRDRREDLMPLARIFLKSFARRYNKQVQRFDDEVIARMMSHPWPGNVRALQTFIEAAVLKMDDDARALTVADLVL